MKALCDRLSTCWKLKVPSELRWGKTIARPGLKGLRRNARHLRNKLARRGGLYWNAPGVGKGTQAALLSQSLGACHLSTGEVFRAARNHSGIDQTAAMAPAMDLMRQGHLVPDAIVWDMVNERIGCLRCQGGFVLDGFPRTVDQAESLKLLLEKELLPLHAVLDYELPVAEIVSRLSGRRTCEECKSAFHVSAQPAVSEGVCDHCGGRLYQREDDRPEAIAVRLEDYERSTAP